MPGINSEDDFFASFKNPTPCRFVKLTARAAVAGVWYSVFDLPGNPGAGTLAGGQASGASTSAGIVPTDLTAGYPSISDFATGALGYIITKDYHNTQASKLKLYDRLWVGGAYAFNAATSLASQPSFSGRLPLKSDGVTIDYSNLEIWAEQVTQATGTQNYTVTYTNQDGTAAQTTGAKAAASNNTPVGQCIQLPFAAGDCGLQKIESVTGTVSSAGTFNIMVLRPLGTIYCPIAGVGEIQDLFKSGMPRIFKDSALYVLINSDTTSTGVPDSSIGIASK